MMYKYCLSCGHDVECTMSEMAGSFTVRDQIVTANIKIFKCGTCGAEIYDEELEHDNELVVFSAYRDKAGLLQPKDIKRIRDRHGLTQRQFSLLLGFGEKTVTRYENGSIQDVAHDLLMRLVESPQSFIEVWQLRREAFTTAEQEKVDKKFTLCNSAAPLFYQLPCNQLTHMLFSYDTSRKDDDHAN
ncbi:MAG: hypothetical protein A2Y16_03185 [Tenericutes bacterium GWF2_57_13]|nr:MAG: hypothetical protein A2Y16_03185 [Tenericutes bacterium GWF2_57_13]